MKFQTSLEKSLLVLLIMGFGLIALAQEAAPEEKADEVSVKLTPTGNYAAVMSGVCEKACGLQKYDVSTVVDQAEAMVGDITRCNVSGVAIKINESTSTLNYRGQQYYTCCATCAGIFEKDPERFLR